MARGSFAANMVRGKAGIYVFYRSKGQQLFRAYNDQPNDAKTRAQGTQRSAISNIIRVYQSATAFFAKAFQSKPTKWSDYNALVSFNLKSPLKIYIPKEMADEGGGVVAPYIISDGSLQSIITTGEGVNAVTNIAVGADFVIDAETTVGALTQAILANNTFIQEGDQLSYLSIEQYTKGSYPALRGRMFELVLSSGSTELVYDYMPAQAVNVSGGFLAHGDYVYSGAFAWVLSRNTANGLLVSRQSLICTSSTLYSQYATESAATRAAVSYNNNSDIFLNPGTESGGSSIPSQQPSIAQVTLEGDNLMTGQGAVQLTSATSIAAGELEMQGSALNEVTTVSIKLATSTTADGSLSEQTVSVPVTVEADVLLTNTDAITLTGGQYLRSLTISINSQQVYKWTASADGSGDQLEDPLA